MITTSSEWDIVSQMPGEKWFAARLYYGDATKYVSIGSKDFVLDDEKFIGLITNKPEISGGFDIQTRECKINSGKIELIDRIDQVTTFGELASTLGSGNDIGFENRRVDIRLMKDGITKFENGFPLLENGRMYRPQYDAGKVSIKVEDNTKNLLGTLGELVTQDDARSGYTLPSASAGKIKPIIYGPKRWTINAGTLNSLTKEDWDPRKQPRFTPMVNLGGGYWMIEDHEIAGVPAMSAGDSVWFRNPVSGDWAMLGSYTVIQNSSTGVIISLGLGGAFGFDFALPLSVTNQGASNFTNPDNAIDQDVATAATISITGAGNTGILRLVFPEPQFPGTFSDGRLSLTGNGDWGTANDLFVDGDLNKYYTPADLTTTFDDNVGSAIAEGDLSSIDLTFRSPDGASTYDASILDVYRYFTFVISTIPNQVYWGGQGHALEAWIDDAGRSSHFNYLDSGDPAVNPASVLESIARNDMGLGDDDINMDLFDAWSNNLSAYLANFQITQQTDFKLMMSQMAFQFRSIACVTTGSKIEAKIIEDLYTSADVMISYNDIEVLEFDRTDDDQMTSKLAVEYSFDGSAYLNNTNEIENTTTRTRYNLSEAATSRTIKADKIDDDATADLLNDFELAFWQQHHNTIKKLSVDESYMKYGSGDVLRITDLPVDEYPNGENIQESFTRAGQTILPYFLITGFSRSDRLHLGGIQMADYTP